MGNEVKQHAEAVRELAAKLRHYDNRAPASQEAIENDIAEALSPLLELSRRAQGSCDSEGFKVADELEAELTRWEPPQ